MKNSNRKIKGKNSKAPKRPRTRAYTGTRRQRGRARFVQSEPTSVLKMPTSNRHRVSFTNVIANLTIDADGVYGNYIIPINPARFPVIVAHSQAYEKVRIVSLSFEFRPLFGVSIPGSMVAAIDYDGRDSTTFYSYNRLCSLNGESKTNPKICSMWQSQRITWFPRDSLDRSTMWDIEDDKFRPDYNYLLRASIIGLDQRQADTTYFMIIARGVLEFGAMRLPEPVEMGSPLKTISLKTVDSSILRQTAGPLHGTNLYQAPVRDCALKQ